MIPVSNFALLSLVTAAIHLPVRKVFTEEGKVLDKRESWQSVIRGNGVAYLAEVEIGTPAQKQTVVVDTGSSDLWFHTPQSCQSAQLDCSTVFDVTQSSSLVNTTIPLVFDNSDGSSTHGIYIQDTLGLAGTTIEGANCAYANSASVPATFGIGFVLNQPCVYYKNVENGDWIAAQDSCTPYKNAPQQMKEKGKISSTAYSIWLNNLSANKGNILFGGVDHTKYLGPLVSLPIEAEPIGYATDGSVLGHLPQYTRTLVTLNQVKVFNNQGATAILMEGAVPVLLDTGSKDCSLPTALIDSLAHALNAQADGSGKYYVDCAAAKTTYLALNFRGLEVQVPLTEFTRLVEGQDQCYLGAIVDDSDAFLVIGDNVLSSFYAVFDLDNGEIALAPAIYNQEETDIEDISSSIPGASQAPAFSYSFSSYLIIDPSATLFPASSPTSTSENESTQDKRDAEVNKVARRAEASGTATAVNGTTLPSNTHLENAGVTNIITLSTSLGLPFGIPNVYSAGRPSTLGVEMASIATFTPTTSTFATDTPYSFSGPYTTSSADDSGGPDATVTRSRPLVAWVNGTLTNNLTAFTTYSPAPTPFTYGNNTIYLTNATTLTETHCDSSCRSNGSIITTETVKTTVFTTYCPEPTVLTYGTNIYTITEATTLTITDCPTPTSSEEVEASSSDKRYTTHDVSIHSSLSSYTPSTAPIELSTDIPSTVSSNDAAKAGVCMAMLLGAVL